MFGFFSKNKQKPNLTQEEITLRESRAEMLAYLVMMLLKGEVSDVQCAFVMWRMSELEPGISGAALGDKLLPMLRLIKETPNLDFDDTFRALAEAPYENQSRIIYLACKFFALDLEGSEKQQEFIKTCAQNLVIPRSEINGNIDNAQYSVELDRYSLESWKDRDFIEKIRSAFR